MCNFYAAGADGVSPLQFAYHWEEDGPDPVALRWLRELKSPESIAASGDRHYVFLPLWLEDIKTYKKEAIVLSRDDIGRRGEFRCRVCEDFPADPHPPLADEGSRLTFFPMGLLEGDEMAVEINGTPIPSEHLRWQRHADGRPTSCTVALSSPPFVYGDNYLGQTLTRSAEGTEGRITVERVECMVRSEKEQR